MDAPSKSTHKEPTCYRSRPDNGRSPEHKPRPFESAGTSIPTEARVPRRGKSRAPRCDLAEPPAGSSSSSAPARSTPVELPPGSAVNLHSESKPMPTQRLHVKPAKPPSVQANHLQIPRRPA